MLHWGKVSQALKLLEAIYLVQVLIKLQIFLIWVQWYNIGGKIHFLEHFKSYSKELQLSLDTAFSSESQNFISVLYLICSLCILIWVDFNSAFCSFYCPWRKMIWARHSYVHISNPLWKDISMTNSISICKDLKHPEGLE